MRSISSRVRPTDDLPTSYPIGIAISLAATHRVSFDTLIARLDRAGGISGNIDPTKPGLLGITVCPREFRRILSGRTDYSIPSAARELQMKQEVAYHLARKGILVTTRAAALPGKRISLQAMQNFRDRYLVPSHLKLDAGRYRGWAADQLIARGARPVSGPGIDGGRQYVFLAKDGQRLLPKPT